MDSPIQNRRYFLSTAGLGTLALGVSQSLTAANAKRPSNILIVGDDDQGYRDLGCYGGEEIVTPHLNWLADEGVRLTPFYVTLPACTPSRGSLLTGRYSQRNGTYDIPQRKEMFWKRRGDKAARVGNWKWVNSAKGSGLFDLSRDVSEKTDLAEDKPDVLKMVQGRYAAWLQDMEKADPRGPFRDY